MNDSKLQVGHNQLLQSRTSQVSRLNTWVGGWCLHPLHPVALSHPARLTPHKSWLRMQEVVLL